MLRYQMKRLTQLFANCVIGWCAMPTPVAAQYDSLERRIEQVAAMDPAQTRTFLERFQRSLAFDDRPAVCAMALYPLSVFGPRTRVTTQGRLQPVGYTIRTPQQCEQQFRAIFTSRVVESVLSARFEDLFANYQGVMISSTLGKGANVWLMRHCRVPCQEPAPIKIMTINR